jgi:hypothetical protein
VRLIECERCRERQPIYKSNAPLNYVPVGWTEIDGMHLCGNCDDLFRQFIKGEAVPAITPEAIP